MVKTTVFRRRPRPRRRPTSMPRLYCIAECYARAPAGTPYAVILDRARIMEGVAVAAAAAAATAAAAALAVAADANAAADAADANAAADGNDADSDSDDDSIQILV